MRTNSKKLKYTNCYTISPKSLWNFYEFWTNVNKVIRKLRKYAKRACKIFVPKRKHNKKWPFPSMISFNKNIIFVHGVIKLPAFNSHNLWQRAADRKRNFLLLSLVSVKGFYIFFRTKTFFPIQCRLQRLGANGHIRSG